MALAATVSGGGVSYYGYLLCAGFLATSGGVAGRMVTNRAPVKFRSTAVIRISAHPFSLRPISADEMRVVAAARFRSVDNEYLSETRLAENVRNLGLYPAEQQQMPMSDVVETMRRDVTRTHLAREWENHEYRQPVRVSFAYSDAGKAQTLLRTMLATALEANRAEDEAEAKVWKDHFGAAAPPPTVGFAIAQEPSLPLRAENPDAPLDWRTGAALGLAAGLAISAIVRRRRWTWFPLAFAVAGCGMAAAMGYLFFGKYTATATMVLEGPQVPDTGVSPTPAQRIRRLKATILGPEILTSAGNVLLNFPHSIWDLPHNLAALRNAIHFDGLKPSGIEDLGFRISYSDSDPEIAKRMISELTSRATEAFKTMELERCGAARDPDEARKLFEEKLGRSLEVLDPPTVSDDPDYPYAALAIAGVGVGLAAAAIVKARPWLDWKQAA